MDTAYNIAELRRWLSNIVTVGFVSAVDKATGRVRVRLDAELNSDQEDGDDSDTDFIPVMTRRSHKGDRDSWLPEPGEQVVVLSITDNPNDGFVIGTIAKAADASGGTSLFRSFSDGTSFEYDKEKHALTVNVGSKGSIAVTVTGGGVTLTTDKLDITATKELKLTSETLTITGKSDFVGAATFSETVTVAASVTSASVATGGIAAADAGKGLTMGEIKGQIKATGKMSASEIVSEGDVLAGEISLKTHVHKAQGPTSPTGAAEKGA